MPGTLRQKTLEEAIRIGSIVYGSAIEKGETLYWMDVNYDALADKYIQTAEESIYNGNAGFLLFFIELYRATGDTVYLDIIRKNAAWLIAYCDETPLTRIAFYSGRSGVCYVLLLVYQLTGEQHYLNKALDYLQDCWQHYKAHGAPAFDILNGMAGILIALLHLCSATQDESLVEQIRFYTQELCSNIRFGRKAGIYWDRTDRYIDGLCGFSHGVIGFAWILTEIAHYFKDEEIAILAQQALEYELEHYNSEKGNWPDFRKNLHGKEKKKEARQALQNGQHSFFTEPVYMYAWCHGAPGIGQALARIYELTGNKRYLPYLHGALDSTLHDDRTKMAGRANYSLCHGPGGNSFLLNKMLSLNITGADKEPVLWNYTARALAEVEHKGDYIHGLRGDCPFNVQSLFNGLSGVGYFYLSVCSPHRMTNILCPEPDTQQYPGGLFKVQTIRRGIVSKAYPVAFALSPEKLRKKVLDRIDFYAANITESIRLALESVLPEHPFPGLFAGAVQYESMIIGMDKEIESNIYFLIYNEEAGLTAAKLMEDIRTNSATIILRSNPHVLIYESNYNWRTPNGDTHTEVDHYRATKGNYFFLLRQTAAGVTAKPVNALTSLVINLYKEGMGADDGVKAICSVITDNESEIKQAEVLVRAQVAELVKAGLLVRG